MKSAKQPQPPENPKDPIARISAIGSLGLPVVPGAEYLADTPTKTNPPPLQEVQRILSKLRESLSAEVRRLRDAS